MWTLRTSSVIATATATTTAGTIKRTIVTALGTCSAVSSASLPCLNVNVNVNLYHNNRRFSSNLRAKPTTGAARCNTLTTMASSNGIKSTTTSSATQQQKHQQQQQQQKLRFKNPAVLVCDLQEKFQTAIYQFDKVVLTTQKLLTFANHFQIPIHATTQTVSKLGPTVPSISSLLPSTPHDKTLFSMSIPPLSSLLPTPSTIALVGIESHICITQTALDLRDQGHKVYVLADGVSSCNPQEVAIALDRLRAEVGITVTSSESWMYECVGDAKHEGFKGLIGVVKGAAGDTKQVLEVLPPKL